MDRKEFIIKSCRWAAGAGALYLAGNLISCSSAQDDNATTSSAYGGGQSADPGTADKNPNNEDSAAGSEQSTGTASVAVVVSERCIGCGKCARGICPNDAISIIGDLAVIGASCNGCGRCISYCPRNAIQLTGGVSSSRAAPYPVTAAAKAAAA
ncbi:MAG: 4Fe-4S binding protein [Actinomycetota bacterium]